MTKIQIAEKLAEYRQKKDWDMFFILIDGHERQKAFLDVYEEMSPQDYWKHLGNIIQGESFYDAELKRLLTNESKDLSLRHLLMNENDQAIFNELPDTLIIYRGAEEGVPDQGWSWSLSEDVADFFAKRFHKSVLMKGECARRDVIAYFGDRNEQEILIPFTKVKNVRILKRFENEDIKSTDNVFYKKDLHKSELSNYATYKSIKI